MNAIISRLKEYLEDEYQKGNTRIVTSFSMNFNYITQDYKGYVTFSDSTQIEIYSNGSVQTIYESQY